MAGRRFPVDEDTQREYMRAALRFGLVTPAQYLRWQGIDVDALLRRERLLSWYAAFDRALREDPAWVEQEEWQALREHWRDNPDR